MKNRKSPRILIVFGTRPELIKLAPVIKKFHESELTDEILVINAAQQEDLINDQLKFWQIEPDITFNRKRSSGSMVRMQSETMDLLQDVLDEYTSLEYLMVQGDTNTTWAGANFAFLNKLKIIHIEAGLRTYDLNTPFPEEFNRIGISKIAYHHFAPTEITRKNLIDEGVPAEKITVCGNTVADALMQSIQLNTLKTNLAGEVIITMHRRENIEHFYHLLNLVESLIGKFPLLKFRWITHPNYKKDFLNQLQKRSGNIIVEEHLPYSEFIQLYATAKFVITDSGGVTEEASLLGIPVVVFRGKTERLEPLQNGYPMIVSLDKNEIEIFFQNNVDQIRKPSTYFGKGNTSEIIIGWIKQELNYTEVNTAIIGGGPAGTGTLLKSMKDGTFDDYSATGIAVIEKTSHLIIGSLSEYHVNSDTLSDVFLECLEGWTGEYLDLEKIKKEKEFVQRYAGKPIPLFRLESFFLKLSSLLTDALEKNQSCHLFLNSTATYIKRKRNGGFVITLNTGKKIICKHLIMSPGGSAKTSVEAIHHFECKLSNYSDKTFTSDEVIKGFLDKKIEALEKKDPRILILGGNHSAFSAADYLIKKISIHGFPIAIWGNTNPKIFYPTAEEALSEGYLDFTQEDICPVTNRLYRLAGLRMDGRDLYRRILGLDKNIEKKVNFHIINQDEKKLIDELNKADIIIHAFGYEFNVVPLFDEKNEPIIYEGSKTGFWVNNNCEMLDGAGNKIENLFAAGLASGFIPTGSIGGEPSFHGQTNGFWYYQNCIAEMILQQVLSKYYVDVVNLNLVASNR